MAETQLLARLSALNGYRPITSIGGPDTDPNTLFRALNYWIRAGGRLQATKGASQLSSQNLGARMFPLDILRGEIAGGLVGGKLPKASLVRYQGTALFFVSENTSQQVYINESTSSPFTLTGVTTSATARKLRVATLSGTTYTAFDAGLDAPISAGTVAAEANGSKSMDGIVSIVACARRTLTDYTSNPSPANVQTVVAAGNNRIRVTLGTLQTGQDGWLFGGTDWGSGNTGDWFAIRELLATFTGSATNGLNVVAADNASLQLRAGDRLTLDGVQYYVASGANAPTIKEFKIASNAAGTILVNFPGTTGNFTITMNEVALDWRNGELGDQIEFDNDQPPPLDGIAIFNGAIFGWAGNVFIPSKITSPESFPRALRRTTQSGGDIIHAIAGDQRIYLLTTTGLEVVNFTQDAASPFIIRKVWSFGFSSPTQAVVADGNLYAIVGTGGGVKIVRTRVDDSPDLEFGAAIESDLLGWQVANAVAALDPTNGAVLVIHNDGTTSTAIPFLLQLGVWSPPQTISGQVKDAATVGNNCEMTVYNGSNFRATRFEGGDGSTTEAYAASPFLDKEGIRQEIEAIKFTGLADSLSVFVGASGSPTPDVTRLIEAEVSFPLTDVLQHEEMIQTTIQNCQSFSLRVDSIGASAEIHETTVWGSLNLIPR